MADETPVTPPDPQDTDALGLPTKVDKVIRWGMIVLGIVLASLGSLYPTAEGMPDWVRIILVVGGFTMTTFKGLGFNVIAVAKNIVGK
jgi:hypothetical protein